jgi:hypothetical protein
MNKQLQTITQKEVTRKEFLTIVGVGAMSVMGFGSIIKLLNGKNPFMKRTTSSGYGSSAYGG